MSDKTKIEWCDYTFNGVRGCAKVNTGCKNCYAEKNVGVKLHGVKWGTEAQGGTRVVAADSGWEKPIHWNAVAETDRIVWDHVKENPGQPIASFSSANKFSFSKSVRWYKDLEKMGLIYHELGSWFANQWRSPRVFAYSLGDVFEDWQGPILNHLGQQLFDDQSGKFGWYAFNPKRTKDPAVTMQDVRNLLFATIDRTPNLDWLLLTKRPENVREMWDLIDYSGRNKWVGFRRRENVWLGASVSDQETAEKVYQSFGWPTLAKHSFLSIEPLVGRVDLKKVWRNAILPNWVIVGGESGPNARICNVDWIRQIVEQCRAAKVPVFVKQLGSGEIAYHSNDGQKAIRKQPDGGEGNQAGVVTYTDKKGGDPSEWPQDLRLRMFPGSNQHPKIQSEK